MLGPRHRALALGDVLCRTFELESQMSELAIGFAAIEPRNGSAGRELVARGGDDLCDGQLNRSDDRGHVGRPNQADESLAANALRRGRRLDDASGECRRRQQGRAKQDGEDTSG